MAKKKAQGRQPKALNKVERFYIQEKCMSLSLDQIKTDLRKTGVNVDEFYNECKKTKQEELIKAQKRAKVVTKTAEGRGGVAIMTGSEAERTNGEKPTIKSKKIARHIHTIK